MRSMRSLKLALGVTVLSSLLLPAAAGAAEPNEGFATATGPLTAGQTFKASIETVNDADFQFFYLPDATQLAVTTFNDAKPNGKAANRGRTIVSSLLRARKGKLPVAIPATTRTLKPGQKGRVKISVPPGKYFIPIGHSPSANNPLPNIPFRIQIGPVGSTTDSYEIFARRCNDAHRAVMRAKDSKKNVAKRLAKAKRKDKDAKVRDLRAKLAAKRLKVKDAQRLKRIVCSVPQ